MVAIGVGTLLWAFLPRGAVLTRSIKTDRPDTWELKNSGPVAIRVVSARILGPDIDEALPWDGSVGVELHLDDENSEIAREDWRRPWNEVVIPPGDTLHAVVGNNTSLVIKYRRGGLSGVLERRIIAIHGSV